MEKTEPLTPKLLQPVIHEQPPFVFPSSELEESSDGEGGSDRDSESEPGPAPPLPPPTSLDYKRMLILSRAKKLCKIIEPPLLQAQRKKRKCRKDWMKRRERKQLYHLVSQACARIPPEKLKRWKNHHLSVICIYLGLEELSMPMACGDIIESFRRLFLDRGASGMSFTKWDVINLPKMARMIGRDETRRVDEELGLILQVSKVKNFDEVVRLGPRALELCSTYFPQTTGTKADASSFAVACLVEATHRDQQPKQIQVFLSYLSDVTDLPLRVIKAAHAELKNRIVEANQHLRVKEEG